MLGENMKYLGAFLSVGLCVGSGIASAAMQVDTFQATGTVNNLANADDLISGVTLPSATSTSTPAFVDHYDGTGLTGNFANNLPNRVVFLINLHYMLRVS